MNKSFVYPGHPIETAWQIKKRYKTVSDAVKLKRVDELEIPVVFTNFAIRANGASIWIALNLLSLLEAGKSIEYVVKKANRMWKKLSPNKDKYKLGISRSQEAIENLKFAFYLDT